MYGHKVFLTTGASGLIVDCFVKRGNPADSTKAVMLMERAVKVPPQVPRDRRNPVRIAARDGRVAS
jgi:IS5 family transposase